VVPDVLPADQLARIRQVIAELVAGAAQVTAHNEVYDLEPSHTPEAPRVRRIKTPHKHFPFFNELTRNPRITSILAQLIGENIRLHGSKLNKQIGGLRRLPPCQWRISSFCPAANPPYALRRAIREQSAHALGIALNRQQQRTRRGVRRAPALLPIAQRRDGKVKGFGEFRLRHSEALPQHLDARYPSHLCQLFRGERLRIGIG